MKNEYYHKLTELKKREPKRIDLGAIDDFEKLFNKALDGGEKVGLKLIDNLRKAETGYKKSIGDMQKVLKLGDSIKKSAKDLGIDLPKTVINKIDSAAATIKEEQGYISKIKGMYNIF